MGGGRMGRLSSNSHMSPEVIWGERERIFVRIPSQNSLSPNLPPLQSFPTPISSYISYLQRQQNHLKTTAKKTYEINIDSHQQQTRSHTVTAPNEYPADGA